MYNQDMQDQDFYSIKDFAKKMNVSPRTIHRAIKNGRIGAFRIGSTSKGMFRIPHSEIGRLGIIELEEVIENIIENRKEK